MKKLEGSLSHLRRAWGRWLELARFRGARPPHPVGRQVEDPELFTSSAISAMVSPVAAPVPVLPTSQAFRPALSRLVPSPSGELELWFDPEHTLLVPEGSKIVGQVRAPALCLLGEIEGDVQVGPGPAVIGSTGRLQGSLIASGGLLVAGQVTGRSQGRQGAGIRCAGELDVACTGRVLGDVAFGTLRVRPGGTIEGRVGAASG